MSRRSAKSDVLRVGDVAERLAVDESTVRRWIRGGHLEAAQMPGGLYFIRPAAVDEMLDRFRVAPSLKPPSTTSRRGSATVTPLSPSRRRAPGPFGARIQAHLLALEALGGDAGEREDERPPRAPTARAAGGRAAGRTREGRIAGG